MRLLKSFLLIILATLFFQKGMASIKPTGLLTDLIEHTDRVYSNGYILNIPIWKIDETTALVQVAEISSMYPSFSWIVAGERQGTMQVAYQIIVDDSYTDALDAKASVWNSKKNESGQSSAITYQGKALKASTNYFWRVKTHTSTDGESEWSDVKAFRTASKLANYANSHYPLLKTRENPIEIINIAPKSHVLDFGKAAFAQLQVTLFSEKENDTVLVHLGERLNGKRIDRKPGGTIRYQCYPLSLKKGRHSYKINIRKDKRHEQAAAIQIPQYIGEILPFRYCEIEGYDPTLSTKDVVRESVHYYFDETASSFSCSNDTLNQIWDLCKYSIKATSFAGIYVDGDRERIPYEADALINQLSHYGVDREYSMARYTHEYLLQHPTWPTEWIMQALMIAWYDYMYTGDMRSLKENYELLKSRSLLSLKGKNGFISTTTGLITPEVLESVRFNGTIKDIVDWPHTGILGLNKEQGGEADAYVFTDYNTVINAYHYQSLKLMTDIAKVLKLENEATMFRKEATELKIKFNKTFLDSSKGYYIDGISTDHASLHANMFPLVFGLVPEAQQNKVLDFIRSRGMACSVYGSQFLMDALYDAGESAYALSLLTSTSDRSWYNMIRSGSTITMEAWDDKYKPNQDWNHAWGAVPANTISRKLMGVEALSPAFETVKIKPQIASLNWAKASIPSIKGNIEVSIQNNCQSGGHWLMELVIPANMQAEVYLPLLSGKYKVIMNNKEISSKTLKKEKCVFAGKVPSGRYVFELAVSY